MSEHLENNLPPRLSDEDAELLSAYIDQQLESSVRSALEARMEQDPFLQSEYRAMQQTVGWLNEMPQIKAPRDFTLSAEDVQSIPRIVPIRRRPNLWLSAAAAIFLVLFGFVAVLTVLGPTIGNVFEEPIAALNESGAGASVQRAEMQVAVASTQKSIASSAAEAEAPMDANTIEMAAPNTEFDQDESSADFGAGLAQPSAADDSISDADAGDEDTTSTSSLGATGGSVLPTLAPLPTQASAPSPAEAIEEAATDGESVIQNAPDAPESRDTNELPDTMMADEGASIAQTEPEAPGEIEMAMMAEEAPMVESPISVLRRTLDQIVAFIKRVQEFTP